MLDWTTLWTEAGVFVIDRAETMLDGKAY